MPDQPTSPDDAGAPLDMTEKEAADVHRYREAMDSYSAQQSKGRERLDAIHAQEATPVPAAKPIVVQALAVWSFDTDGGEAVYLVDDEGHPTQDAHDIAGATLAALTAPEVVAAMAAVLRDHRFAGIINSKTNVAYCICDAEIPIPSGFDYDGNSLNSEEERVVFEAHQAAELARWFAGGTRG